MRSDGPPHQVNALKDLFGVPGEGGRPSLGRVVLFCNSKESARFVDHTLTEEGYATANYHGAVPANERAANFARFTSGEAHVLVTTDLAARGLDQLDVSHVAQLDAGPSRAHASAHHGALSLSPSPQVSHVVQFDFAKSATDYVHRCGRTARAGKSGTVTNLVTKSDLELVRAIRDAQKQRKDLVAAGDEHVRMVKQRAATELQPLARGPGGMRVGAGSAAFPGGRGVDGVVGGGGSGRSTGPAPGAASGRNPRASGEAPGSALGRNPRASGEGASGARGGGRARGAFTRRTPGAFTRRAPAGAAGRGGRGGDGGGRGGDGGGDARGAGRRRRVES